ncbi:MAG: hypothetical protein ACJ75I_06560 [Solirubrobacterales bacterium]
MALWGARRASRRGRLASLGALALLVGAVLAGCGAKDFPNNPRPATPIEISAKVDSQRVQVAPDSFGAGLVNFTVANLSGSPITFNVTGPTKGSTTEIQPGSPDYLRMDMKEGTYQVTASKSKIKPATIRVGPNRSSSQNNLLEP